MRLVKAAKAHPHAKLYNLSTDGNQARSQDLERGGAILKE